MTIDSLPDDAVALLKLIAQATQPERGGLIERIPSLPKSGTWKATHASTLTARDVLVDAGYLQRLEGREVTIKTCGVPAGDAGDGIEWAETEITSTPFWRLMPKARPIIEALGDDVMRTCDAAWALASDRFCDPIHDAQNDVEVAA